MTWGPLRRRGQPPQILAVDRGSPFGQSVVGLVDCTQGLDLVFGRRMTLSSGSVTVVPALTSDDPPTGRARQTDATHGIYGANRLDWPDWQIAAPFSFFAYWYLTAYAASTATDMGYTAGSDGYGVGEQFGTGNRSYTAGGVVAAPGAVWPLNAPISTVLTFDGATVTGYLNGVADGSTGGGTLSYGSFSRLYAGNNPDGHTLLGGVWYMGICKGLASPSQIRHLASQPFSVYATARRATWLIPAAGAGNVIAVPAGSLTFTGKTPVVTATTNKLIAVPAASLVTTAKVPVVTATANNVIAVPLARLTFSAQTPTVPGVVSASVGGGRSRVRRRDKIIVVAWGQEYEVATQAEAQALFTKLKAEAAAKAPVVVAKAVKKAAKTGVAVVTPTPPKITVRGPLDDFTDAFAQTLTEIAEIYQQAAQVAEIARQAAEDDEDDAIMALLSV